MKTLLQAVVSVPIGLVVFGLLVFWPAGTFDYWQGWAFIAVFAIATLVPSIYLACATRRRCSGVCTQAPARRPEPCRRSSVWSRSGRWQR